MRILASVDGSPASLRAARYAAILARATRGTVVLAHVRGGMPTGQSATYAEAKPVLRAAQEEIAPIGARVEERVLVGAPAEVIPHEIRAHRHDMVAMGNRGRGESGTRSLFLGSTALRVVREAQVPVLLVRATETGRPVGPENVNTLSSILVPADGSLASLDAADLAARITESLGGEATLLHVTTGHESGQEEALAISQVPFQRHGVPVRAITATGNPASTIIHVAREGDYQLLIMGTYGAGEAWHRRVHMGSVAETVLIGTPCPVILVKHPAADAIS